MPRPVIAFIVSAILLATPGLLRADDICTLRPDLCGGRIKKKKISKRGARPRCRNPRDQRDKSAHLPVCSEAALAAHEVYKSEMTEDPRFGSKQSREGLTDDSFAMKPRKTDLDMDLYVNQNAGNPALSRKQDSQQAFIEPKRQVTYGFSGGASSTLKEGMDPVVEDKKDGAPASTEADREPASSATNR